LGSGEVGATQTRISQVGATQVGVREIRPVEEAVSIDSTSRVSTLEVLAAQIKPDKPGTAEIRAYKISA
jgi:hypothetical protein